MAQKSNLTVASSQGGDDAQKLGIISKITGLFKKAYPEETASEITTERNIIRLDVSLIQLKDERLAKYRDYETMDKDIVEIASALDVHADFLISSDFGKGDVFTVEFSEPNERGSEIINDIDETLELQEAAWFVGRHLVKYGETFYEIIANEEKLIKLKYLPEREMFVNYERETKRQRKDIPYYQQDNMTQKKIAEFAPWEIVHFKIGQEDYGVNFSLLAPLRRTYRLVRLLEDTLVVGRISRAGLKGIYRVDVTGMGELEAERYIRRLKLMNRRKRMFDSSGNLVSETDPLNQQEDIYIPVRKNGVGGEFQVIGGDLGALGRIEDIEHFHNKLFAGTKVPKAYLGFERDVNAKATLTAQDSAFVRAVKRHRFALAQGLKKVYRIGFLMAGVNPTTFEWTIKFPAIGMADEEARWKMEQLKAQMLATYKNVGLEIPSEWIIRKLFLSLEPEEVDDLLKMIEEEKSKKAEADAMNQAMAMAMQGDDEYGQGQQGPNGQNGGNGSVAGFEKRTVLPPRFPKVMSETELADLERKVNGNQQLRKLVLEAERAIKASLRGERFEYY